MIPLKNVSAWRLPLHQGYQGQNFLTLHLRSSPGTRHKISRPHRQIQSSVSSAPTIVKTMDGTPCDSKTIPAVRQMASHCNVHFADCAILTDLEFLCGHRLWTLTVKLKAFSSVRLCPYILPNQIKILHYEKLTVLTSDHARPTTKQTPSDSNYRFADLWLSETRKLSLKNGWSR